MLNIAIPKADSVFSYGISEAVKNNSELEFTAPVYAEVGNFRSYILSRNGLIRLFPEELKELKECSEQGMNEFFSRHRALSTGLPFIVFTAGEGSFAYFESEMDFEYMLLEALMDAKDEKALEQLLIERLGPISGENFSFSGAFYGFGSFKRAQSFFLGRIDFMLKKYIMNKEPVSSEVLETLWSQYKQHCFII